MIICNTEIRLRAPLTHTGDPAFFPHQSQALKVGSHLRFGGGGSKNDQKKTVLGSLKEIAYFYVVFFCFFWKTEKVSQFFMLLGNSFVILYVTKINYVIEYLNEVHDSFTFLLITIGPNKFLSVGPRWQLILY